MSKGIVVSVVSFVIVRSLVVSVVSVVVIRNGLAMEGLELGMSTRKSISMVNFRGETKGFRVD